MTSEPTVSLSVQPCWRAVRQAPIALIYKHSPICGASTAARLEVSRFTAENPTVPVCVVDVIRERDLARTIAEALEVPHASPQVILLRTGAPAWVASHFAIKTDALNRAMQEIDAVPDTGETLESAASRPPP